MIEIARKKPSMFLSFYFQIYFYIYLQFQILGLLFVPFPKLKKDLS